MATLSFIRPAGCYRAARTLERTLIVGGFRRGLSNTPRYLNQQVETPSVSKQSAAPRFNSNIPRVIYKGPLTNTFKYLNHTLTTTSLFLRPRHTLITSPSSSLVPSERPMTTWKLRESIENGVEAGQEYGSPHAASVEESVLAITEDEEGNALGRWAVMGMDERGKQQCQAKGKVVRYFNVHPEILQEPIEVGAGSAES
ncbi:hypothetical protein QFC21_000882 [Naganishia friedmannii]|uniref:Uncharacterized protein n=1 Tax=Naganishia friedmannii TaxID=89922 RepID=A0ACC2W8P7_9TREE|nr:hypothetical protein QFC21_000882 [Naganishia friedmannii]